MPSSLQRSVTSVKEILGWFCAHVSKARCIAARTESQPMIRMLKNCGGARDGRRRKREEGSGIQCTSQIAPPVGYQWARARRSPGVMAEAQAFCSHLLLEGSHQVCAELGVPCPRDAPAEPAVAARVVGRAPQPSERAVRGLLAGREEGRLYLLELGAVSRLRCGQPRAGARHERPDEHQDGGAHIPQPPAQRACTTQLERERLRVEVRTALRSDSQQELRLVRGCAQRRRRRLVFRCKTVAQVS